MVGDSKWVVHFLYMSITPDAVRAEIAENANVIGNPVKNANKTDATASTPIYVDSTSKLATGNIPFATTMAGVVVSGLLTTAVSSLDISGTSNPGTADTLMQGQLVLGSRVTTITTTGYLQINITDAQGNITNGVHYIPFGTLT